MKILYNDGHVDACPQELENEVLRHSAAHIMAQAVKRLYPEAHFAYGPATETGFRYDIDLGDRALSEEDFAAIEAEFAGKGYGDFKAAVADAVVAELEPLRTEYERIVGDKGYIAACAKTGAEKAARLAYRTLNKVMKKVGFYQV